MLLASVLALFLLTYGVAANLRPTSTTTYVVRNLAVGAVLVLVARAAGLSWETLGLDPADLGTGYRWGRLVVLAVAVVVALAAAGAQRFRAVALLFSDRRADLAADELAVQAFVRIPLGTALFEEVAFRGVLLGAFLAAWPTPVAVAASSVTFGLWHVVPTLQTLRINRVDDPDQRRRSVLGAVVVTTVAGVLLALLRLGTGTVLTPVLAHAAVNSLGLLAAAVHQRLRAAGAVPPRGNGHRRTRQG